MAICYWVKSPWIHSNFFHIFSIIKFRQLANFLCSNKIIKVKKIIITFITILFILSGCNARDNSPAVIVPNIISMKLGKAQEELDKVNLILQVSDTQYNENIPVDYIISQDPKPLSEAKQGSIVKVVVSLGPKDIIVPNVTNKDFYDAVIILKNIGLTLGEIKEVESEEPVGMVLFQDPSPNVIVSPSTKCNLTVSIGKFIEVPNVIGMNVNEAKTKLENLGLTLYKIDEVEKYESLPSGIVLYQYPFPGAKVAQGALILLRITK